MAILTDTYTMDDYKNLQMCSEISLDLIQIQNKKCFFNTSKNKYNFIYIKKIINNYHAFSFNTKDNVFFLNN